MFIIIWQLIWFFLPGLIANMAPVYAHRYNWLPLLNYPIDGGWRLGKYRVLGNNKTIRGLVVGLITGSAIGCLQALIVRSGLDLNVIYPQLYHSWPAAVTWGATLAFGALAGDALKSFLKRRLAIPPGHSWIPWDQIDIVIGMLVMSEFMAPLSFIYFIFSFLVIGILMYSVSFIGVLLNIKQAV